MSDDEKPDEPGIYKVETVPPPAGEDDAYSAPTKVGPMADAAVRELMQAAERRAAELSQRLADKKAAAAKDAKDAPASGASGASAAAAAPAAAAKPSATTSTSSMPAVSARTPPPPPVHAGPVTGRLPAPIVGPVGRTITSPPPASAKPAS